MTVLNPHTCHNNAANLSYEIGCIIMASGHGRRFGQNKLMYPINGKEMIACVFDAVPDHLKDSAYVVTRYEDVKQLAESYGFQVLMHSLPVQSDTIKVGLSHYNANEIKGCIFLSGDQPFITQESINALISLFYKENCSKICRLGYNNKQGAPVIFPASCFSELNELTGDTGGRTVVRNHLNEVAVLQAASEKELLDIDTPEDLIHVSDQGIS